jgi:hypothetical protein
LSTHPLIEQSNDPAVRRAASFRKAAEALKGPGVGEQYRISQPAEPPEARRFVGRGEATLASAPRTDRAEHLAMALVHHAKESGKPLEPPAGEPITLLDCAVPLWWGKAGEPATQADLLGIDKEGRLTVASLKFQKPNATRGATGETPLRGLLEALAYAALADADREALSAQLKERFGHKLSPEPPRVLVVGNAAYWQLCRRREAQRGAAWIAELERLAGEIDEELGITVQFLCVDVAGDPGWAWQDGHPVLEKEPELVPAWERSAGRIKPPSQRSGRSAAAEIIEADPTRPVRPYQQDELFGVADAIEHDTLGRGVVQRVLGPTKIEVRFGDVNRLLVHGRRMRGAAVSA